MRYLKIIGVVIVIMVMWRLSTFRAAAMDGPSGTYRDSCRNIRMRGDDLRAECRKANSDDWRDTELADVDRCWGDIANDDGRLICNKSGTLPRGGYVETCRDVRRHYDGLRAVCRNRDGRWVETYLERFGECRGEIVNDDGRLYCRGEGDRDRDGDRDGDRRGYPRGSYTETCTDIQVRGDRLIARCRREDDRGWRESALEDFGRCVGAIVNDDGYLRCTRPGGRVVPRGTYVETCRDVYVYGDILRARCQNTDGRWVWSQLNEWDDCRSGIFNVDGHLECRR